MIAISGLFNWFGELARIDIQESIRQKGVNEAQAHNDHDRAKEF